MLLTYHHRDFIQFAMNRVWGKHNQTKIYSTLCYKVNRGAFHTTKCTCDVHGKAHEDVVDVHVDARTRLGNVVDDVLDCLERVGEAIPVGKGLQPS